MSNVPADLIQPLLSVSILVCVVGFLLNLLLLTAIFKSPVISKKDMALYINLSFADGLSCLVIIVLQALRLRGDGSMPSGLCDVYGYALSFSNALSVWTLWAMAFTHWYMFVRVKLVSALQMTIILVIVWLAGLGFTVIPTFLAIQGTPVFTLQPSTLYCITDFLTPDPTYILFNYGTVGTLLGTPILIGILYFMVWHRVARSSVQMVVAKRTSTLGDSSSTTKTVKVHVLIIKRAVVLATSFALLYYFPAAMFLVQLMQKMPISWQLDTIAAMLLLLKNLANPIIFIALDTRCRASVLSFFGVSIETENIGTFSSNKTPNSGKTRTNVQSE
ncbi:hypothetical protein EDD86DRAFT_243712 [Gorgonomyces haynaldii]|nr:hypothetical protein EDD86DRAFT_243712 [Gorgonomyces haynaldii]